MFGPAPCLSVSRPVPEKPGGSGDAGDVLEPDVLAAEEDAETAADSAGLIHRAAIDIAEVVKRGGIDEGYSGHGCGEGGEGSDEETVVALLHCPQQYGDCDQPEEMRLDAEGEEQGCARSKPMPGADKAEKGDEASEDERSNLAQLIRVAERQE